MTPQEFLDEFGTLTEAEGGVQKLRDLILELAVRGTLVKQDASDEPAGKLVDALTARRSELIKTKKIKKKLLPELNGELPSTPPGWTWTTLSHLGEFCGGGTPSKKNPEFWGGNIPWVSPKDMKSAHITGSQDSITRAAFNGTSIREIPAGSILIVARSGILKRTLPVSINDVTCTVNQDLKVIIPFDIEISEYMRLMLRGHEGMILRDLVKGGMTVQSLRYEEFEIQPFPIPPLAEQHRIVAKVDELMRLCDGLEAVQKQRRGVRLRLNRSTLDRLTSVSSQAEVSAAWQRVCDHFQVLYDTPETLPDLRQTILQLAVQGKLVKQDPNDEPAEALLSRMSEEVTRLVKTDEIKKPKQLPPVDVSSLLYQLPSGWAAANLGDVVSIATGFAFKSPDYVPDGIFVLRVTNIDPDGSISRNAGVYMPASKVTDKLEKYYLEAGEILVVMVGGSLGKIGVVTDDILPALLNQNMWRLKPLTSDVDPKFLRLTLSFINQFQLRIQPSTHGHLSMAEYRVQPIGVPPLPEQKRIVSKVTDLLSQVTRLESTLTRREATRTQLLTAAIDSILTGENELATGTSESQRGL